MEYFKLELYVPVDYAGKVKAALAAAGAGRIGNYDSCIWECPGVGQFRPLPGSAPFLGREGEIERVPENKLEMVVAADCLDAVLAALRATHPYETPAFQFWPVNLGMEEE
ncbi:divalent cation tolerance protein CutA [uncultured Victivallis sp.]|uniref:divalent cation tolerance protein CutA n=1 Tax=uncultured Victivallis sp. TaxID=354118 RepID=UPI0025D8F619|nr:divalent cation tolerance protein CutA [uncultured Victivallis sp.]